MAQMQAFNFYEYMLDCSVRLKELAHTDENPCFFQAGSVAGLQELINNIGVAAYPAHVILDNVKGHVGDKNRSNNFIDNPFYTGFIITAPLQGNAGENTIRQAKQEAKEILFKILGKMRHDRYRGLNGLNFMNFLSVPYQEVGPLGAGSYGVMYNIEVPHDHRLPYNESDWIQESR